MTDFQQMEVSKEGLFLTHTKSSYGFIAVMGIKKKSWDHKKGAAAADSDSR